MTSSKTVCKGISCILRLDSLVAVVSDHINFSWIIDLNNEILKYRRIKKEERRELLKRGYVTCIGILIWFRLDRYQERLNIQFFSSLLIAYRHSLQLSTACLTKYVPSHMFRDL